MVYHGRVKNGVVVLDEAVSLPEGIKVIVDVLGGEEDEEIHPEIRRFSGILPADLNGKESYRRGLMGKHR